MTARLQRPSLDPGLSVLAALATLSAASVLAWAYLARPQTMTADMMSNMAAMPMMGAGPASWTPAHAADVLAMWSAMALAMMLPAAAPALWRLARTEARAARRVLAFAGGYLLLWLAVAVVATALQWALEHAGLLVDGVIRQRAVASGAIAAVGISQLLPTKRACLARCAAWSELAGALGGWSAARAGVRYGLPCLGASGPLMLLPVATGLMGAPWLALLTLWLVLERVAPRPGLLAALGGLALMAYAAAVFAGVSV